ncbi:MAG: hypothetical protein QXT78_02465 [Candidatus Nitrosocaldus sp.]
MGVKSILVLWGSAPALAIATVFILNMLSAGMHAERGEEAVSIGEVGKEKGSIGEEKEQQQAEAGDVVGMVSEPEERGRMLVQEPSAQMAPVREAQIQEQYVMLVLPYITSTVAASLSFIIVRRFVHRQG